MNDMRQVLSVHLGKPQGRSGDPIWQSEPGKCYAPITRTQYRERYGKPQGSQKWHGKKSADRGAERRRERVPVQCAEFQAIRDGICPAVIGQRPEQTGIDKVR